MPDDARKQIREFIIDPRTKTTGHPTAMCLDKHGTSWHFKEFTKPILAECEAGMAELYRSFQSPLIPEIFGVANDKGETVATISKSFKNFKSLKDYLGSNFGKTGFEAETNCKLKELIANGFIELLVLSWFFEEDDLHLKNIGVIGASNGSFSIEKVVRIDFDMSGFGIIARDELRGDRQWTGARKTPAERFTMTAEDLKCFPNISADLWYWPTTFRKLVIVDHAYTLEQVNVFSKLNEYSGVLEIARSEFLKLSLAVQKDYEKILIPHFTDPTLVEGFAQRYAKKSAELQQLLLEMNDKPLVLEVNDKPLEANTSNLSTMLRFQSLRNFSERSPLSPDQRSIVSDSMESLRTFLNENQRSQECFEFFAKKMELSVLLPLIELNRLKEEHGLSEWINALSTIFQNRKSNEKLSDFYTQYSRVLEQYIKPYCARANTPAEIREKIEKITKAVEVFYVSHYQVDPSIGEIVRAESIESPVEEGQLDSETFVDAAAELIEQRVPNEFAEHFIAWLSKMNLQSREILIRAYRGSFSQLMAVSSGVTSFYGLFGGNKPFAKELSAIEQKFLNNKKEPELEVLALTNLVSLGDQDSELMTAKKGFFSKVCERFFQEHLVSSMQEKLEKASLSAFAIKKPKLKGQMHCTAEWESVKSYLYQRNESLGADFLDVA